MNNESKTILISLFAGLFAAFLLYSYSQEKKKEYDKKYGRMVRVVVASRDIQAMETIDDTMLDIKESPEDYVQPNYATDVDSVVGQVAASPIQKGEQLTLTKLLTPGPDTGISLQVAPGNRAVTVPVDEVRGVAKLIRPGDRIDIVVAVDVGKGFSTRREVSMLMQDVVVLATGLNVVNNIPRMFETDQSGRSVGINLAGDTKYSNITIEADPKQAQDLIFILSTSPSNLFFILRNPNDRGVSRLPTSTLESVLGKPVVNVDANSVPGIPQAPRIGGSNGQ